MTENFEESEVEMLLNHMRNHYHDDIFTLEQQAAALNDSVQQKLGLRDVETGLAPPQLWDLNADRQPGSSDHVYFVTVVSQRLPKKDTERFLVNIKQLGKFVVGISPKLSPDISDGLRVCVDRNKYQIRMLLPRKVDAVVSLMQVEDRPSVTFEDVGGCADQLTRLREVVELPLTDPGRFIKLGIDPPKGVLLYGPPGTGKTLVAKAIANRTNAAFIRVIGSELVQKYVGEGARLVREIFQLAKTKKAAIVFFDEVDAFGGTRFDSGSDNEVQRTMLELINQLDGFDSRGNVKVLMATNRPDTLDPALLRPGRLDRKIEFGIPDLDGRTQILKIHARYMSVEKNIRYELLARHCTNATGAELRSVCTEAGMFAIRERRKLCTEKDFFEAIDKVIKKNARFSATPRYLTYN